MGKERYMSQITQNDTALTPLAFFDSGAGGLPYLSRVRELLPLENFLYLADTLNFPFGEKAAPVLIDIILGDIERLIRSHKPKLLVVACNTASVVAIEALRKTFPIPFVGVVPAVKPAASMSRRKRIGVLATARTVSDPYLDRLIEEYAKECSVVRYAGRDIVNFVETRITEASEEEKDEAVCDAVLFFKKEGVDAVVLGCTDFLYLKDRMKKAMGEAVEIIDSVDGVAKQTERIAKSLGLSNQGPSGRFFVTNGIHEGNYLKLADLFGLQFCGIL